MAEPAVYTVSELQREVQFLLESEYATVWVEGEVSDFRRPRAGHLYFTLKDPDAQLSAVMWRSSARRMRFDLENGLAVRARGYLTVYPAFGRYQMIVQRLEPVGAGPLQVRFEQLRAKLESEGLFDPARKKPLPRFPRRVALVTSAEGAAVRDLIHVARRRWPPVRLLVVPVRVQGAAAAAEIAAGIRSADALDCDAIVVGRGGGSLEDLWAFNEEAVARAVFHAHTPVVSAVGHEIDVSIADLVADHRAATPSAAAEAVTPDVADVRAWLTARGGRLARGLRGTLAEARRRLDHVRAARPFRRPLALVHESGQRLDATASALAEALVRDLRRRRQAAASLASRLEALSPLRVLARGYSVTLKDARVVRKASDVEPGDELRTRLAEGEIRSRVV